MKPRGLFGSALHVGAALAVMCGALTHAPRAALAEESAGQLQESAAQAQESAAIDGRALYELTGMDVYIASVRPGVDAGVGQTGLPQEFAAAAAEASSAFDDAVIGAQIIRFLDDNLAEPDRADVAGFYRSPLGARMVAAENANVGAQMSPDYPSQLAAAAEALTGDPDRAAVIRRMGVAVHAMEMSEITTRSIMRAIIGGMLSAQSNRSLIEPEAVDGMVEQQMAALLANLEAQITLATASAYRDVSDEDLSAYLEFMQSEPAQRFFAATYRAMADALTQASYEFGRQLSANLAAKGI